MTTAITLDKQDYPLMMHLSILPKYDISNNLPDYDPTTQSSTFNSSMASSWCRGNCSTGSLFKTDEDQFEDD
ncbi:MAG: hypothetical protein U7123_27285 [Potamolinea sp.]